MRILVITSTFQKTESDPVTDFVFSWLKEFQKRGHEVKVIAAHCAGVPSSDLLHGIPVERFRYFLPERFEGIAYGHGVIDNLRANPLLALELPFYMAAGTLKVLSEVKKFKPDVVHALWVFPNGFIAAIARKLKKFPLVVSIIGSEAYLAKKFRIPWMVSFPANSADLLVSVSGASINAAKQCGVKKPVEVVFNGFDSEKFNVSNRLSPKVNEVRNELGISKKDFLVLCVGRMVERKGQRYVIGAMPEVSKKFPNAKLVFLGKGQDEEKLKALAKELGVEGSIIFAGTRGHDSLPFYYAASDVFVIPSIIDSSGVAEGGQGLVTKEAMASGVAVIGTNT